MELRHPINEQDIQQLIGHPICAVLLDGTYCFGTVSGVKNGKLYMHGLWGKETISTDPEQAKAQLSGFGLGHLMGAGGAGGGLGGLFGAGGAGAGAGMLGRLGGKMGFGLGMISMLFSLFRSGFFI